MNFWDIIKIVKKWRMTAAVVSAIAFFAVLAMPEKQAPVSIYRSTAQILITPPKSTSPNGMNMGVSFAWFADPMVLEKLLKSEELLMRVVENSGEALDRWSLAMAITVEPFGRMNRVFALSVTHTDPDTAQKLTQLLTEEFSRYVEDLSAREFISNRRYIEELVVEAEQKRNEADAALQEVRERYLGLATDEVLAVRESGLKDQLGKTERDIAGIQAEISSLGDYLEGRANQAPHFVLSDSTESLGVLEVNVTKLRKDYEAARQLYTPESSVLTEMREDLAKAEQLYRQEAARNVSSYYEGHRGKLKQLLSQRDSILDELDQLAASRMSAEDRQALLEAERERQIWRENYLSLQQQLYAARVAEQASRRQGSVSVLEKAGVAGRVSGGGAQKMQGRVKTAVMMLPFCLLLGGAAAFVKEYLASSGKLRPRIEEALEIPIIAVIPSIESEFPDRWSRFRRPTTGVELILSNGELRSHDGEH